MQYTGSLDRMETQLRSFVNQVYGWMAGGLALTALIAMWIAGNVSAQIFIASHPWLILLLFLIQIGMVFSIAGANISGSTATIIFIIYSALMGINLSSIFWVYAKATIALAFFSTAGMFGAMAIYGYTTKADLTRIGSIAIMALIGLIIASLLNIFFRSSALDFILSIIGVVIFSVLTAYDSQKIKEIGSQAISMDEDTLQRVAISGALALYLDFINLFLFILQLLGRRES